MFSIYSSLFNINKMSFKWRDTLDNWIDFCQDGDEIVLAVNDSSDDTVESLMDFCGELPLKTNHKRIDVRILETHFSYGDPLFDGKIKNAALKKCREPFLIALDLDEVLPLYNRPQWVEAALKLNQTNAFDAFLIPVVNLWGSEKQAENISCKWYLHRNSPNLGRGSVNFAKNDDGTIDIEKSDTCELINESDSSLAPFRAVMDFSSPDFIKMDALESNAVPFAFHIGGVNLSQRAKQNVFWKPIWENRAGHAVGNILLDEASLRNKKTFDHCLPHWSVKG